MTFLGRLRFTLAFISTLSLLRFALFCAMRCVRFTSAVSLSPVAMPSAWYLHAAATVLASATLTYTIMHQGSLPTRPTLPCPCRPQTCIHSTLVMRAPTRLHNLHHRWSDALIKANWNHSMACHISVLCQSWQGQAERVDAHWDSTLLTTAMLRRGSPARYFWR